jgi:hypothetical protein
MSGDAKFDLRTRIPLTPDVEPTANARAAFAHSRQPPMTGPLTVSEDLRIHTYSVVPHPNTQIRVTKTELGLNVSRLGMLVCVPHGFAHNPICLVTDLDGQLTGLPSTTTRY